MAMERLVLYTNSQMGHLIPMVELGKLLLSHGFSITVTIFQIPFLNAESANYYISRVSAAFPSLSFKILTPALSASDTPPPANVAAAFFNLLLLGNQLLLDFLSSAEPFRAIIIDFLSSAAIDVAVQLDIPPYIFVPSSASTLNALLYIPTLHSTSTNIKNLGDEPIHFPGLSRPIPASHLPSLIIDRDDEACKLSVVQFERILTVRGILINSFEALEREAFRSLIDGVCVPGRQMPPVFGIGPIIGTREDLQEKGGPCKDSRHESLAWLDSQPNDSVVFLNFGSLGTFSEAQVKEIALGLERSKQRFLWVVRAPAPPQSKGEPCHFEEPDLNALLPDGFLERTEGSGLVVKLWAPQRAVLNHPAVAGFVTHCGWNSLLEAIMAGVAMIAWPMYAEQAMNKLFIGDDEGLAVEMRGHREGIVGALEVEERVRWLFESEEGKELKKRVAAVRERGHAALREGGSSYDSIVRFAQLFRDANGNGH